MDLFENHVDKQQQSDLDFFTYTEKDEQHWHEIIRKRSNLSAIATNKNSASNLTTERCCRILLKGIDAVIFDYDQDKHYEVILKLNQK